MTGSFKELNVYQLAFEAANALFTLSKSFPKDETYSLTDQIRRSSRSVCADIEEGYHKRIYPKHFTSKMTDADGEASETTVWLDFALTCGYLSEADFYSLSDKYAGIGRMLYAMANNPKRFLPKQTNF
jgi:four helix bundle protein